MDSNACGVSQDSCRTFFVPKFLETKLTLTKYFWVEGF